MSVTDWDVETYEQAINFVNGRSIDDLKQLMETVRGIAGWWLFPSGWRSFEGKPYPGKLAEALVETNAKESVSDIYNTYYASNVLSPEALAVFQKDVVSDINSTLEALSYMTISSKTEFIVDNEEMLRSVFMKSSEKQILRFEKQFLEFNDQEELNNFYSEIGLEK